MRPRSIPRALTLSGFAALAIVMGTPRPGWSAWPHDPYANLQVAPIATEERFPSVATDGAGGAFIAWQDGRVAGNKDIYVQHVTSAGAIAPRWPAPGRAAAT